MRLNAVISFLKYAKEVGSNFFIPVEDAYLVSKREIWKNDVDKEINRFSNMVSQCKLYISNSSTINRTVKQGINPTRYEEIEDAVKHYFSSKNYEDLSETVKSLENLLQSSSNPETI